MSKFKQYEVIAIESIRTGYLVTAESEEQARDLIEHPERSYQKTFEEYHDLESIESVELQE